MKIILTIIISVFCLTAWALPKLPVVPTIAPPTKKCFAVQTCAGKVDGIYTNPIRNLNTYSYKIELGQPFPTAEKIRNSNATRYLSQEKTCNKTRYAQGIYSPYDPQNGNPSWNEDSRAMFFKVKEVCISTLGNNPVMVHNPCERNADCPSQYRCNITTGMCYNTVMPAETTTHAVN